MFVTLASQRRPVPDVASVPMKELKRYRIELECDYEEWWRYNLYISAACYNADGGIADYVNLSDKVYDIGSGIESRTRPAGYARGAKVTLETPPCVRAEFFLYAVANTFPHSDIIRNSPPFSAAVACYTDGRLTERTEYAVNQWGGLTLKKELG